MDDMRTFEDEPSFSLNDFRKWMDSQNKPNKKPRSPLIGIHVESKLATKRLAQKMVPDNGCDLYEMAREFRHHGGTILEIDEDNNLTIEVDSGTFEIPKYFVRKVK